MSRAVSEAQPRTALVVRALGARHDARGGALDVFAAVSLEVARGEVLGVAGPNGCGKTTLLRTIAGLRTPAAGEVSLPRSGEQAPRIALVPQAYAESFFPWASLALNVALACRGPNEPLRSAMARAARVRDELGLDLDLRLRPARCSSGMLQQAAIVRALAAGEAGPDLLLADEPFSALDVDVARSVRAGLAARVKRAQTCAIVVLHDVQSLVETCDRVLVIEGRPYSTEDGRGVRARIVTNTRRGSSPADRGEPFGAMMRRVLGDEAGS